MLSPTLTRRKPILDNCGNPIFSPAPREDSSNAALGSQNGAFTAGNTVDGSLKTPYSYTLDLSVAANWVTTFYRDLLLDASPTAPGPRGPGTAADLVDRRRGRLLLRSKSFV